MSKLTISIDDGVATLAIRDESTSNAIDIDIIRSLHVALDQIQKGESEAKAVVLTGTGAVFCSGVDLHTVDLQSEQARQRTHADMRRYMDPLIQRLSGFRFPIVSAVNGAAVGAGMSLALASDIIVVADDAFFLPSFARLGLVPDAGITFHLARRIGAGRALSSLMLAEKIGARTAFQWGLAYSVVPQAQVVSAAQMIAGKLAKGPVAVLSHIRALQASTFDHSLQTQLREERSAQEMSLETHDCVEGVRAFFERREPHFDER